MLTLPELTAQDISAIINAPRVQRTQRTSKYFYIDVDGTRVNKKPTAAQAGGFFGNVGTMTRSRKGRARRNANGSRKYDGTEQVVAYKV